MRDHSRSLRPSPDHSPAADQSCWSHLRTHWRCPPPPVRSAPAPFGHRLPAKTGRTQWLSPFPRPAGARKFRRFLPLQQWMPHRCPQPQKQPWAQCSAPLPVSETPQGFVSWFMIPFYFICTGSIPLCFHLFIVPLFAAFSAPFSPSFYFLDSCTIFTPHLLGNLPPAAFAHHKISAEPAQKGRECFFRS